jgi:signal transduction histidine kinase
LESFIYAQRQFVANASHELRTPLALQRAVIQVALDDPDATNETLRAGYERVLASGANQERLVEALLSLSRGQAGLDRREHLDLSAVVDDVLLGPHPEIDRLQLHIETNIASAPLDGDPRLVERLAANLLDNALRYNLPGGRVKVTTQTRDGNAVLSVINTGPAVPLEAIQRLLQPFQRLGPDRTSHGDGLGLGLSIVQAIATAHNASLSISPQPAAGLAIDITFPPPRSPAHDPAKTATTQTPRTKRDHPPRRTPRNGHIPAPASTPAKPSPFHENR